MRLLLTLGLMTLLHSVIPASSQAQNVILSELCDPRLNYQTDRFIEIYNAGASSVDLTGWQLVAVGNGSDIFTWNLSGSIAPGEALVAGDQTTTVAFTVDFQGAAWSDNNGTWNGKVGDGAKLLGPGATLVDYAVVTGTAFENDDYVRNSNVTTPTTSYNASEWTATAVDLPTEGTPGTHSASPPTPVPSVTNLGTDPPAPLPAQSADVLADVTDGVANITTVEAHWGTVSGSLTNTLAMSLDAGDTYRTDSPIPGQAGGVTVYYEVEANNDQGGTTVSSEQSYTAANPVTIAAIQGGGEFAL